MKREKEKRKEEKRKNPLPFPFMGGDPFMGPIYGTHLWDPFMGERSPLPPIYGRRGGGANENKIYIYIIIYYILTRDIK